jgi:capsular polysaccharide export protein
MHPERNFLFLQGNASRFFGMLGAELAARGYCVNRINFNGGDRLFWPLPGAVDFRRGLARWPGFLEAHLDSWNTTDILLFGDCRPLHRDAVRMAERRRIRVYVFDEGYIRPNWMTMELGGTNGNSSLPRDAAWYRAAAAKLPPWSGGLPVVSNFSRRAWEDVLYNVSAMALVGLYPGYRTHRPWHPLIEYAGWLYRFARGPAARRRIAKGLARLAGSGGPYYFFPLQLDCDSQIRNHSPFGRIAPTLYAVIDSFARRAPKDSLLVIKEHPLDNCLTNWRRLSARIAAEAGVSDRVVYLEDGPLEPLLAGCRGVTTVNSTVGFLALSFGKKVITLGTAVYDMPDLTFQGELDVFWNSDFLPDTQSFDAFRRVTVGRTQVNGGFFSETGVAMGVKGAVDRLEHAVQEAVIAIHPSARGVDPGARSASQKTHSTLR